MKNNYLIEGSYDISLDNNINKIIKTRLNLLKNSNYDFKSIFEIFKNVE